MSIEGRIPARQERADDVYARSSKSTGCDAPVGRKEHRARPREGTSRFVPY